MIYLDNAATTKPSKEALQFAQCFNDEFFFNPSALYQGGLTNSRHIKSAKENILKRLGAVGFDVTFTSCGTESDNLAVFGVLKRGVFVTCEGEHAAIYKSFMELKNRGIETVFIPLKQDGSVDEKILFDYVKNNPVDFISLVHVNNETGAINDVNYIAKTLKTFNNKIIFHVDGVQAFGKIPYRLSNDIDLYSVSAHKINGLKGTGALIRKKTLNVHPIIIGGGQENGLRSGTENIFGIKVFDYVINTHFDKIKENYNNVQSIKNYFIENLDKTLFTYISGQNSTPYILTVSAKGLRGEVIMHSLEQVGVIIGNGSACSSKNRYSRVIKACGYKEDILDGVIRISFDTNSTLEEAKTAVDLINEVTRKLKGIMK